MRSHRPSRGGVGKKSVIVKPVFLLNTTQYYPLDLQEIKEKKNVPVSADVYFYWRQITTFITKPSPNRENSWVKIYQQFLLRDYFRTTFNYSLVFCILQNKETIWKFVICDRNKNEVYWAKQCLRQIWIGKVPQEIRAIQL